MDEWKDRWRDGWMAEWQDRWRDGWINVVEGQTDGHWLWMNVSGDLFLGMTCGPGVFSLEQCHLFPEAVAYDVQSQPSRPTSVWACDFHMQTFFLPRAATSLDDGRNLFRSSGSGCRRFPSANWSAHPCFPLLCLPTRLGRD